MVASTYSTNGLHGTAVHDAKHPEKRIGKVHTFVFHPHRRMVVGFTVKRPDLALMFHRPDLFVALDSFEEVEGHLLVEDDAAAAGKAACKRLGIDWDECILWQGMPLVDEAGELLGHVGNVTFDAKSGQVVSVFVDQGGTRDLLLGMVELPAEHIQSFRMDLGDKLRTSQGDDFDRGAIVVAREAFEVQARGGLAAKAGAASAVAGHKVGQAVDAARPVAANAAQRARELGDTAAANTADAMREAADNFTEQNPEVAELAQKAAAKKEENQLAQEQRTERAAEAMGEGATRAGELLGEGAAKLGRQFGRSKGVFANFKESYRKAMEDDE